MSLIVDARQSVEIGLLAEIHNEPLERMLSFMIDDGIEMYLESLKIENPDKYKDLMERWPK